MATIFFFSKSLSILVLEETEQMHNHLCVFNESSDTNIGSGRATIEPGHLGLSEKIK